MALFFFTGVGNASTFQMIPVIMGREVPRLMPQLTGADRARQIAMESGGIVAFTSAIGAYGGFFIPKAYGSSIAMTGSPIGALWLFLAFYVVCLAITWVVYTRPGGLLHDIERGRASSRRRPSRRITKGRQDEPPSRQTELLPKQGVGTVLGRLGSDHAGKPRLGGHLQKPLAARQDRALNPRGELHRVLFVEDLRQVRHRDLGNPADRLSPHPGGPAEPRTARLRAGGVLQLVSLFRQPGEEPADPGRADAGLAQDAPHDDPRRRLGRDPERSQKRASYTKTRGKGGFVRATWDEATEIIAAANAYTAKTHGPDRVFGFSPIPAMSMVSYAAGSRYLSLLGGTCMSFYDWYCDLPPASPQTWGEQTDVPESADWYNAGFLMLWGSNVPQTRTPDAHFYTEVRYRGTKSAVVSPDYSEAAKFGDIWLNPQAGTDAALAMAMGHVILREYPSGPAGRVFRGLRPQIHRHADAGPAGRPRRPPCPRPHAARRGFRGSVGRNQQPRLEDSRL
jgi:hypothetical protein